MNSRLMLFALLAAAAPLSAQGKAVLGYIRDVPPETAAAREARHQRVAERRRGTCILVHRGAASIAPENTLEAYAAAMDYGADGVEIDIRRTADGVIVLFHDDMLDGLTEGFGDVSEITYYQLLALQPRRVYGRAKKNTRPPTLAALLALAQQRAMLLHLDIKRPGLEDEIAKLLDAADCWDHVVVVNSRTAPDLAKNAKIKSLRFKGPGLYAGRKDVDAEAVKAQLARPGQMIMVDDPRVAAQVLGRKAYQPVPLPKSLREKWQPRFAPPPRKVKDLVPAAYLAGQEARTDPDSWFDLVELLMSDREHRMRPEGTNAYQTVRARQILSRAWAAQRLGQLGKKQPIIIKTLEYQIKHRSLHKMWQYHGLDGAMSIRALALLGATESAPALREAFLRIDPELKRVQNPRYSDNPLAWSDFRTKMSILPALGELVCEESKAFLQEYVAMDEAKARELAPIQYRAATAALLKQDLSQQELEQLLRSPNGAVRGTAILACVDHPTRERKAALKAAQPWALELPRAR